METNKTKEEIINLVPKIAKPIYENFIKEVEKSVMSDCNITVDTFIHVVLESLISVNRNIFQWLITGCKKSGVELDLDMLRDIFASSLNYSIKSDTFDLKEKGH